jgi:hypothetical protein
MGEELSCNDSGGSRKITEFLMIKKKQAECAKIGDIMEEKG